ncbi:MAG TPA: MBG domain-containing protein [Acidimicrobiales bacterium]|nr:MBG domain-containing protein [Acidimicrobiales bacterium]
MGARGPTFAAFACMIVLLSTIAAVVVAPSAPVSAATPTKTVPLDATFTTSGQPLFDPSAATPPTDITDTLFESKWNQSAGPFGGLSDPCTAIISTTHCQFGVSFSASTNGDIGMSSTVQNMKGGAVGVSYPVHVDLTAPADNSFTIGDPVTISSSGPTVSAASITTAYPDFDAVSLDGVLGFGVSATGTACVFTCFLNNTSLLNVNFPSSGTASGTLFGVLKSALNATNMWTSCFSDTDNTNFGFTTYSAAAGDPAVHSNCGNHGYLAFPRPAVSSSTSNSTVSASGSDSFIVVPTNAVKWASQLSGVTVPNGFPTFSQNLGSGLSLGYTVVSQTFTSIVTQYQDLSFAASGVNVKLDLPQSVAYTIKDGGGSTVSTGTGSSISFPAGDKVSFIDPANMSITPTLSLAGNTFTNHTYDKTTSRGNLQALSLSFNIPGFSFDLGGLGTIKIWDASSVTAGPVVNVPTGTTTSTHDLFNASWTLAGFSPVQLTPFSLVPDPPPTGTAVAFHPVQNVEFNGVVARFSDPDTADAAHTASNDYSAIIDWGDHTIPGPTGVTITGTNNSFTVSGIHTYTDPTPLSGFTVTVTVTDKTAPTVTARVTQTVAPLAITSGTLPNGRYGSAYPLNLPIVLGTTGGTGPFTWAVVTPGTGPLPNGLTLNSSTGALSGATATKAGTFPFTVQVTDSLGTVATKAFSITIDPAPLTITASSPTITYGAPTPAITPGYTGLKNGNTAPATPPTCSVTPTLRNGNPVAGTYTTSCTGAADNNYTITPVTGLLTVNRKALTITASSATITYGAPTPPVTPAYAGLTNGDTAPATPPTCSVTPTLRNGNPVAGTYTTSCTGAADNNYTITPVTGLLTVNKAELTITADNKSRVFGAPNPTFTFTPSGFVNGDDASVLSGTPSFSAAAITTSVGNSPIVPTTGGLTASNYSFKFVNGQLTITPDGTTTSVIAAPDPSTFGTPVTITATVTQASPGTITPYGSVVFTRAGNVLGTISLNGAGTASLPISSIISGQTITATYLPADANFIAGPPASVSPTVTCAPGRTITGNYPGSLYVTGPGGWCISGASIAGRITIGPGASVLLMNSTVGDTVSGSSPGAIALCGSTLRGSLSISGATSLVMVGDPVASGCLPNTVNGSVTLMSNHGGLVAKQNRIWGNLTTSGNSGAGPFPGITGPQVVGNIVSGATSIG